MERDDIIFVCELLNKYKSRNFRVGETFSIDEFDSDIFEDMKDRFEGSWVSLLEFIENAMIEAGWVDKFDIYLIINKKWGKVNV